MSIADWLQRPGNNPPKEGKILFWALNLHIHYESTLFSSFLKKKKKKVQGKIILFKCNDLQHWNAPFQYHLPQNTPAWVTSEPGSASSLGLLWFVTIPVSAVIFKQPFIPSRCLLPTRVPVWFSLVAPHSGHPINICGVILSRHPPPSNVLFLHLGLSQAGGHSLTKPGRGQGGRGRQLSSWVMKGDVNYWHGPFRRKKNAISY